MVEGTRTTSRTVVGVVADPPSSSSLQFEVLMSLRAWNGYDARATNWRSNNVATYVRLQDAERLTAFQPRLDTFTQRHFGGIIADYQEAGWWVPGDDPFALRLQPLEAVHFDTATLSMVARTANPTYVWLLGGIGLLVLLVACINFMTLATGRATTRIREIGLRQVLGAQRQQLMGQFWGEALLLSSIAAIFAVALAELFLPVFNTLAATSLAFQYTANAQWLLGLMGLVVVTGLLAGSYPALVLSGFRPTQVLQGRLRFTNGRAFTRSVVVFQFIVSIGMGICALIMLDQIDYMKGKDVGFADEEVVAVTLSRVDEPEATLARFASLVEPQAQVQSLTGTSYGFNGDWSRTALIEDDLNLIAYTTRIDPAYLETLGMTLVAGRNLSEARPSDATDAVLVNETFVREMGWTDPVGQPLPGQPDSAQVEVVGVVGDFHFLSMHEAIQPTILHMDPAVGSVRFAMVRLNTEALGTTLAGLEAAWQQVAPNEPFQYAFLDARLDQQYRAEERWSRIVVYAAFFAVLIACLGLFGLATLAAARRTKEVGIRKVMGASVPRILGELSLDFIRLVAVAFVLACPLAYLAMDAWRDNFAYQSSLTITPFVLAGSTAILLALITVSYQAARTALANPVDALRYE